jgi:hypothetical protein
MLNTCGWRATAQGGGELAVLQPQPAAQVLPLIFICITSVKARNSQLKQV